MCEEAPLLIDLLPDTPLLHIFGYLTFHERKDASLVNKRWRTLCQLPRFMRKNTLVLYSCMISRKCPPWSVLAESDLRFRHLIISGKVTAIEDSTEFWSQVGQFVETITFTVVNRVPGLAPTDTTFPKLKELNLYTLEQLFHFNVANFPKTIESLRAVVVSDMTSEEVFQQIKQMKNLKSLTANMISLDYETSNNSNSFQISALLWDMFLYFQIDQVKIRQDLNLLGVKEIGIAEVRSLYPRHLEVIDVQMLKGYSSLKKLSVRANEEAGCFFMHEVMPLPTVQKVCISFRSRCPYMEKSYAQKCCTQCLKALVESCPNFDSWKLDGCVPNLMAFLAHTPKPLRKLHLNLTHATTDVHVNFSTLEKLHVSSSNIQIQCNIMTAMPKLRKVYIGKFVKYDISNLVQMAPHVSEITFEQVLKLDDIACMEQHWPYLKVLNFVCNNNFDEYHMVNILCGNFREMRSLGMNGGCNMINYHRVAAFKKIPTLRRVFDTHYSTFCNQEYGLLYRETYP